MQQRLWTPFLSHLAVPLKYLQGLAQTPLSSMHNSNLSEDISQPVAGRLADEMSGCNDVVGSGHGSLRESRP